MTSYQITQLKEERFFESKGFYCVQMESGFIKKHNTLEEAETAFAKEYIGDNSGIFENECCPLCSSTLLIHDKKITDEDHTNRYFLKCLDCDAIFNQDYTKDVRVNNR